MTNEFRLIFAPSLSTFISFTYRLLTQQFEIMSDGALFKPERDYTKEADKVIPEAQQLAKVASPAQHNGPGLTIPSTTFRKASIRFLFLRSKPDR